MDQRWGVRHMAYFLTLKYILYGKGNYLAHCGYDCGFKKGGIEVFCSVLSDFLIVC